MAELDSATLVELDRLCEHARQVVDARRHLPVHAALPATSAALGAVAAWLAQAGVDRRLAEETTTRWFVTGRPLVECLAVELDPPYPTDRKVPGVAQTHAPGAHPG